jgi:hypothetical protein
MTADPARAGVPVQLRGNAGREDIANDWSRQGAHLPTIEPIDLDNFRSSTDSKFNQNRIQRCEFDFKSLIRCWGINASVLPAI